MALSAACAAKLAIVQIRSHTNTKGCTLHFHGFRTVYCTGILHAPFFFFADGILCRTIKLDDLIRQLILELIFGKNILQPLAD